jgi:hypothetical protein
LLLHAGAPVAWRDPLVIAGSAEYRANLDGGEASCFFATGRCAPGR